MGYGCCGTGFQKARNFLTKEERIELLKEYKSDLDRESQGVVERIKELETNKDDHFFYFVFFVI